MSGDDHIDIVGVVVTGNEIDESFAIISEPAVDHDDGLVGTWSVEVAVAQRYGVTASVTVTYWEKIYLVTHSKASCIAAHSVRCRRGLAGLVLEVDRTGGGHGDVCVQRLGCKHVGADEGAEGIEGGHECAPRDGGRFGCAMHAR